MDQKEPISEPERDPRTRPVLDAILVAYGAFLFPFWGPFWLPFGFLLGVRFRSFFWLPSGGVLELQIGEVGAGKVGSAAWAGGLSLQLGTFDRGSSVTAVRGRPDLLAAPMPPTHSSPFLRSHISWEDAARFFFVFANFLFRNPCWS